MSDKEVMRCHFCGEQLKEFPDCRYGSDEFGEFFSELLRDSVLAHPDCLPVSIDDIQAGKHPEWKMA